MSSRPFQLILIDDDPIFQLGLRTALEAFPDLQVVAEVETGVTALQILNRAVGTENAVSLVVLELGLGNADSSQLSGLQLCQRLKGEFPSLPILLLTRLREPFQLATARAAGVEGYCPKGTPLAEVVAAMRQVGSGQFFWSGDIDRYMEQPLTSPTPSMWGILRHQLRQSGLRQIDETIAEVTTEMQNSRLSNLNWAILAGRRRELRAARWLVNQLLPANFWLETQRVVLPQPDTISSSTPSETSTEESVSITRVESQLSLRPQQATIFEVTLEKLQFGLQNLTGFPLEIDILQDEKRRELLALILQKLQGILEELHFSQVQPVQVEQMRPMILQDLWQAATIEFFGKYYLLSLGNKEVELVNLLLQDAQIVQEAILNKISLMVELFAYLLFQTPLVIDNVAYSADTLEARERAEALLQNLIIRMANGVVQPLLNQLADVEIIKKNFYDRRLISTREIARFRNDLSWKYRFEQYIGEPVTIFESRYNLLVLSGVGIKKVSIYASRTQELEQLRGLQLSVTLALEARDATAPRLRSAVSFLGRGVVYVLTQVIGRAIGLIGRGVIQGIGTTFQETRYGKKSERQK